ncbi:hypothetical protein K458DRAFT_406399 [Lentithecium fluviatile CBS 122367]|uniref:Uncharacterized protein n=1 Tax=Lentithecium fluviatile CBS 122367 TaxID=1168545 RepID=A0A6G1IU41_9PLEO|nr:hypothetical protein K458DRAFT_406399 [Lentithecium fluviatile CBS 122367]
MSHPLIGTGHVNVISRQMVSILTVLICVAPAIHGLWNATELKANTGFDSLWSHGSLTSRGNEPEVDGEQDYRPPFGSCVPQCKQSGELRVAEAAGAKRSISSSFQESDSASSNSSNPFVRRARPLPAFDSNGDLRRMTTKQLGQWMMNRIPNPQFQATDVEIIWNSRDPAQWIDLRPYRSPAREREQKAYGIPTSYFSHPGNTAFAWGTVLLVGCTMFAIVKTPTPQDPSAGIYMAHTWEYVYGTQR